MGRQTISKDAHRKKILGQATIIDVPATSSSSLQRLLEMVLKFKPKHLQVRDKKCAKSYYQGTSFCKFSSCLTCQGVRKNSKWQNLQWACASSLEECIAM